MISIYNTSEVADKRMQKISNLLSSLENLHRYICLKETKARKNSISSHNRNTGVHKCTFQKDNSCF